MYLFKIYFVLFVSFCVHGSPTMKKETYCISDTMRHLTISCDNGEEIISIETARYITPYHPRNPPVCEDESALIGQMDLILDLDTILSYKCEGLKECGMELEWHVWKELTELHKMWLGKPFFQIEYMCAAESPSHGLPPPYVMVATRIKRDHDVHVYGCYEGKQDPSGVELQCSETDHVIVVDQAIVGKTSVQEDRCHIQAPPPKSDDIIDDLLLRDLTIDLSKTISSFCDGSVRCRVPMNWYSVGNTFQQFSRRVNYNGDMYLDVVHRCVDYRSLSTTTSERPPVDGNGSDHGSEEEEGFVETEKTERGDSDDGAGIPLIALGCIGIAVLLAVAGGLIWFSRHIRQRRIPPMSAFKDIDPTYNTTVLRSQKAPPLKFDNIMYDSERHPSGVYDVPGSTSTTPGVSVVAPSNFASQVRVEIEKDDDDDDCFVQDQFPSPYNHGIEPTTSQSSEGGHSYVNMNTDNVVSPNGGIMIVPTYSETYMGKPSSIPAKSDSYVTLNGAPSGQPVTVLGEHRQPRAQSPPKLPPRTPSMVDILDDNESQEEIQRSSQPESLNSFDSQGPTYAEIAKSPCSVSTSSDINSTPASRQVSHTDHVQTPSADSVFEPDTEYYRSLMRNQLVSGTYDNNVANLPTGPYCYK